MDGREIAATLAATTAAGACSTRWIRARVDRIAAVVASPASLGVSNTQSGKGHLVPAM